MTLRAFAWCLYAAVGVFFLLAAGIKVAEPDTFFSSMMTYELFPHKLAVVLAFYAPALEGVLGLSLLSGTLRKGGAFMSAILLLLFIGLIAQGWMRGLEMDCGCFGENQLSSSSDYLLKVGQNILLIAALGLAWWFESKSNSKNELSANDGEKR